MKHKIRNLIKLESIDSTHLFANRLLEKKLVTEDVIIIAEKQTSGIGRCNRQWNSVEGNLFMSMITKISYGNELSLCVACALHDTIQKVLKLNNTNDLTLHWPNDIYYRGKKLSGILISFNDWFVISIGVNIHPIDLDTAISLREIDSEFSLNAVELLREIEKNIDKWLDIDFSIVRNYWLNNVRNIGEEITIKNGKDSLTGIYQGIDESGKLMLAVDDKTVFISSGDMFENMDRMVTYETKR